MNLKICVIGLGYVGLPIYLKLSKYYKIIGFDKNKKRINELKKGNDYNLEYTKKQLLNHTFNGKLTANINDIKKCNFYIVAVPTPIFKNKTPNINLLKNVCKDLSSVVTKNDFIFFESTVYPGVTENICIKIIEKYSGLKNALDFFVGYSPERINPGDIKHQIHHIIKILAFKNGTNVQKKIIEKVFNKISKKIVFTDSIKEAETAKVIENIQRDLNIGLFNEIYKFCDKFDINFNEVTRLASTKWNFVNYKPGLVGGHCLPVDPYYLSHIAKKKGLKMEILLAGRKVNNKMENYIFEKIKKELKKRKLNLKKKILVVGETYKKNVGDQRNSLAQKIIHRMLKINNKIKVYDPHIDNKYFYKSYRINDLNLKDKYEVIIQLVNHDICKNKIKKYLKKNKVTIFFKFF